MMASDMCDPRRQKLRHPGPDLTKEAQFQLPAGNRHLSEALCHRLRVLSAALFALITCIVPAQADALGDCTEVKITAKTIDSCTQVIEAGQADKSALAWAHFNRGTALGMKGQLDRAIADLDKAIELNPQWAAAYSNRGRAFVGKGQPERAVEDYARAIELDPNSARHIPIAAVC